MNDCLVVYIEIDITHRIDNEKNHVTISKYEKS